ncbi:hypothetical protein K2Z84_31985 [Candidatus Binatia bacterium]|nr:hypothetical protein [Candidatus Binatia bacterium]
MTILVNRQHVTAGNTTNRRVRPPIRRHDASEEVTKQEETKEPYPYPWERGKLFASLGGGGIGEENNPSEEIYEFNDGTFEFISWDYETNEVRSWRIISKARVKTLLFKWVANSHKMGSDGSGSKFFRPTDIQERRSQLRLVRGRKARAN